MLYRDSEIRLVRTRDFGAPSGVVFMRVFGADNLLPLGYRRALRRGAPSASLLGASCLPPVGSAGLRVCCTGRGRIFFPLLLRPPVRRARLPCVGGIAA